MDKTTRIYKLHRLLARRRTGVPLERVMKEMECSRSTALRLIREMRDEFMAPIVFDADRGGYLLTRGDGDATELPGVWFSADELIALLSMERLLSQMGSRYLSRLLAPIRDRIDSMLGGAAHEAGSLAERLRVAEHLRRETRSGAFERVAVATLERQRLRFRYHARRSNEVTLREVSPQRLTHHRSNWYLDAWCHHRQALRRFALDRISDPQVLEAVARELPADDLAQQLDGGYGAFGGPAKAIAVLRFQPLHARWAADERWHADQQERWLDDGRYELRVPYAEPDELLMDIQRYGAGVEVVSPPALRQALRRQLQDALRQYGG